ncbi:MAG TPA: hypothetical protein VHM70_17205 [Polyangiaceae bacterium]|nr:hypothetical protein [Polyangiaceae bacterium]
MVGPRNGWGSRLGIAVGVALSCALIAPSLAADTPIRPKRKVLYGGDKRPDATDHSGSDPLTPNPLPAQPEVPKALLRSASQYATYRPGDELVLDLFYADPALSLTADLSQLDPSFDPKHLVIKNYGRGRYRIRYPLSRSLTPAPGTSQLELRATDRNQRRFVDELAITWGTDQTAPVTIEGAVPVAAAETESGRVILSVTADGPSAYFPRSDERANMTPPGDPWWVHIEWKGEADTLYVYVLGYYQPLRLPLPRDESSIDVELRATREPEAPHQVEFAVAHGKASGGWLSRRLRPR